jgi:transposase
MQPCMYRQLNPCFIATATRQQFENRPSGFRKLLVWMHQHGSHTGLLFCLEHTGIYALPLCCFFNQRKLDYSLQSALHVKRSMGIQPHRRTGAKNDKADAVMLAAAARPGLPIYIAMRLSLLNCRLRHCSKFNICWPTGSG